MKEGHLGRDDGIEGMPPKCKDGTYEPRKEASGGTSPADTSVVGSWPSDPQGQGLLLLKSPPGAPPSGQSRLKCVLDNPLLGLASLLNFKWDGDVQGYV